MLDEKLQALLHKLTNNMTLEMGKITQELRRKMRKMAQIGERTDHLDIEFDDLVQ